MISVIKLTEAILLVCAVSRLLVSKIRTGDQTQPSFLVNEAKEILGCITHDPSALQRSHLDSASRNKPAPPQSQMKPSCIPFFLIWYVGIGCDESLVTWSVISAACKSEVKPHSVLCDGTGSELSRISSVHSVCGYRSHAGDNQRHVMLLIFSNSELFIEDN